jgi:hypothetical protein
MDNSQEYIKSKKIKNRISSLSDDLSNTFNNYEHKKTNQPTTVQQNGLSHENVILALRLFGKIDLYGIKESNTNNSIIELIRDNSDELIHLRRIAKPGKYWDGERFELLVYFFGEEMAPYVKEAWNRIPMQMYQNGWNRRSFRSSNLESSYFIRQVNFIISLLNETNYDFSFYEYTVYHAHLHAPAMSLVFAAAIDDGNTQIKSLCIDAIYGWHEISKPSRSLIKAMLSSADTECWQAVEKLLLSAQRQEGLRQTILECLDEVSFDAFKYFIKVILEHQLTRFSSVVRAVDVWAGLVWKAEKESTIIRFLTLADRFFNAPDLIAEAIQTKDNLEVYTALWAQGVIDVDKTQDHLDVLMEGRDEQVFLALYFIDQVNVLKLILRYSRRLIVHSNPAIVCQGVQLLNSQECLYQLSKNDRLAIFDQLEARLDDFPKNTTTVKSIAFSWLSYRYGQEMVLDLMINLLSLKSEADFIRILPYYQALPVGQRESIMYKLFPEYCYLNHNLLSINEPLVGKKRDFVFGMLNDSSQYIQSVALAVLHDTAFQAQEWLVLENLLKRQGLDFRDGVLKIIKNQNIEQIKSSTQNLLHSKFAPQRLAGLNLLIWMKENHSKELNWVDQMALEYSERKKFTTNEKTALKNLIKQDESKEEHLEIDEFGIYKPQKTALKVDKCMHSYGVRNKYRNLNEFCLSKSEKEINKALENLHQIIFDNKNYEYSYEDESGVKTTVLLGNKFKPLKSDTSGMTPDEKSNNYPLVDLWKKWYEEEQLNPLDLLMIQISLGIFNKCYGKLDTDLESIPFTKRLYQNPLSDDELRKHMYRISELLCLKNPFTQEIEFLSDLISDCWKDMDDEIISGPLRPNNSERSSRINNWRQLPSSEYLWNRYAVLKRQMSTNQFQVYWHQVLWRSDTFFSDYYLPDLYDYARAYEEGLIEKDILLWRIMQAEAISQLTHPNRKRDEEKHILEEFPYLKELLSMCRDRIIEYKLTGKVNSKEGNLLFQNINLSYGSNRFIAYLKALGKSPLYKGKVEVYYRVEMDKKESFSHLLKNCYPLKEEAQETFNKLISESKISTKRLCEASIYAPQWLPFVARFLAWENMESAVWWLYAHSNGLASEQAESEISKYTSINQEDFNEGVVDVNWFRESYTSLGDEKWEILYDTSKIISTGIGHKRCKLYTDVLCGKILLSEIEKQINESRKQDYLRAYGLAPLNQYQPEIDLLNRYQLLQKFLKESKQFGSQRQVSEAMAFNQAMENLSRTAGYSDSIRLQWTMETKEAQKIIQDAQNINLGDTLISLNIDENGSTAVNAIKEGKILKSIPAKYRKHSDVIKLQDYCKALKEQSKRTLKSLETAMVNGDIFSKAEIENMIAHPLVSPMIQKLVLISKSQIGFYHKGMLINTEGMESAVSNEIRIAHPVDLYEDKNWTAYQSYCFTQKIKQPFKQIFRELYLPTADELREKSISRRYAGHQIQPRKTLALLKSRGWTVNYTDGLKKVHQNITAHMFALAAWFTPADIEAPCIETVAFFDRTKGKRTAFKDIDKRLFSETMRDIDLVISVAHVGQTDPESSQSSIELRIAIARETCQLFKLENVSFSERHAKIKGEIGEYSVHMGSGICHQVANATLSIIPVHSQHRGRMFLPFMDQDPKTAEILSKIVLLAKDKEIQDPTILQQLQ